MLSRKAIFIMVAGLALGVLVHTAACADVKLPTLISDNMVLQRGVTLKFWGTADAGERVTVSLAGHRASTTTRKTGRWQVRLSPLAAGGPYDLVISGKNTITVKNVLIGEVWLCSGQSNMQMVVRSSMNFDKEAAAANYPNLRVFTVASVTSTTPKSDVPGSWAVCTPKTVGNFSAVAYFFGRDLQKSLGVPIGLINSSWGGTQAEAWTQRRRLTADPDLKPQVVNWDSRVAVYPEAIEKYNKETIPAWQKACAAAKAAGKPEPRKPYAPPGPNDPNRPGNLYNAMIVPLLNYQVRGALWYQGESNAGRGYIYRKLLPTMIQNWREAFRNPTMPFYIVSLANYMAREAQPSDTPWAEVRESQLLTSLMPHNGQSITIDIGDATNIHPTNKQEVGRRLCLLARNRVYGQNVVDSGPTLTGMKAEGGKLILTFASIAGGLRTSDGKAVTGFAIAGEDRKFVWADAVIQGNTVVLSSAQVAKPVAARYAWANNPACNLINGVGLPTGPFRTDEWPGPTFSSR